MSSTRNPPLVGALLRLASQRVRREMLAGIRARGFEDLQDAHLHVFQYPGPDATRPSDLARQLHMTRQAVNHLIAQLERLGYLERRAGDGQDRRRVYLTARGHRLVTAIRASVRAIERRYERAIGAERFGMFLEVLRSIVQTPANHQ
jgi:DNA-binding MarR family transcriptional regulator